jgi:hypothetical protein
LHQPKAAEPQEEESLKMAPFGGSSPVEERAVPPGNLDAQALYAEDDDDLPPLADEVEVSKFRPRRDLFVGGALLAVVLATGVTYAMVQSEKSVALPPIIAADPGEIVPAAKPADNDQQKKLIHDYVDGAQSADRTKLVTPGSEKVAEVPASSGDHNPIPHVTEPAGPDFDQPAKADDTVSADPPVTDLAASGESGQISPKGTRALAAGPEMPVAGSKATSDDGAGKLLPGATPAVPPSATPATAGAADASSDAPSGEKQMEAVINGKGSPIPINADPLALNGGGGKAAADGATPARRRSPEPASVSVNDTSNAAALDNGAAAADDGSAVPAAPARVPIPRARPIVLPHKAGRVLPDNPAVADRRRDTGGSALGNPYLKN